MPGAPPPSRQQRPKTSTCRYVSHLHQSRGAPPLTLLKQKEDSKTEAGAAKAKKKTMAELDEELRLKLEEMSGDGGAAGLELEDGKPVAMKRGVKNNMFRLI